MKRIGTSLLLLLLLGTRGGSGSRFGTGGSGLKLGNRSDAGGERLNVGLSISVTRIEVREGGEKNEIRY